MAEPDSTFSPEELVEQIKDLRCSAWAGKRAPATEKEAQQIYVQDRLRELSIDLIQRGVTLAILEGTFLVWWLRVVCAQRFDSGGFEFCLAHIGQMMQPIPQILERLYEEIEDAGPMPEMRDLGKKVDALKTHAGRVVKLAEIARHCRSCAVNRHHYSTEAECIDRLVDTKTEDRALRRRNSSADFGAGIRRKLNRFPPAYILAQSEKSRGYGGGIPI